MVHLFPPLRPKWLQTKVQHAIRIIGFLKTIKDLSSGSTLLSKHAQAYIFSWGSPPWPATGCSAYELFANGLALGPVQVEAGKRCARVMEIRNDWLLIFPIYHCHKIIFFNSFYTWEGSSCASTIFLHKGIVPETLEIQVFFPCSWSQNPQSNAAVKPTSSAKSEAGCQLWSPRIILWGYYLWLKQLTLMVSRCFQHKWNGEQPAFNI